MTIPETVLAFKRMAAQRATSSGVYRWYSKLVGGHAVQEWSWEEMPPEMRDGWRECKGLLRELGFRVVKDGSMFMMFVDAEMAWKFRNDERVLG